MADRGITFSAAMVRALLAGTKTQTRRLIAAQPPEQVTSVGSYSNSIDGPTNRWSWLSGDPRDCDTWGWEGDFTVPHAIGDRLYVREHWKTVIGNDGVAPRDLDPLTSVHYLADGSWRSKYVVKTPLGRHRQAMHMPRWASRLTLLVTEVRVQRLQDISEADCIAEGIERDPEYPNLWKRGPLKGDQNTASVTGFPKLAFRSIWEALHTDPGTRWEDNPWIYAVTFDVRRGNIDQIGGEA